VSNNKYIFSGPLDSNLTLNISVLFCLYHMTEFVCVRSNFSNYRARFSMPNSLESMVYSFDLGPAHFIAINTEFYYFLEYGFKQVVKQFEWLRADLERANANRQERPWIVTFGHRPMYCSNLNRDDCTKHETLVRSGLPFLHWFSLEDLFFEHGVDLTLWAHEHSYERLFPLYDYTVRNGSADAPYTNPGAPVHVVTGSAVNSSLSSHRLQKLSENSEF